MRVNPGEFFALLREQRVGPFVGVPCSLIASLIAYAGDHPDEVECLNPPHEAHAMAIAAGAYMGSGCATLPMVFLQGSGFGNIVNPLSSLHQIYEIPALLLVTWRAEGGCGTDAPEHWVAGQHLEEYFRTFRLPYRIMTRERWRDDLAAMREEALRTGKPTVLCVRAGLFENYCPRERPGAGFEMTSQEAIRLIKRSLPDAVYLSTTGMISRESLAARDTPDFYMLGSMGLVSGIAAGYARRTDRKVVALDGDGAVMMHMGLLAYVGSRKPRNLFHFVIDNEAYASTGSQATVSRSVELAGVAAACGYPHALRAETREGLRQALRRLASLEGPVLVHVKVKSEDRLAIPRVSDRYTCPEIARRFAASRGR